MRGWLLVGWLMMVVWGGLPSLSAQAPLSSEPTAASEPAIESEPPPNHHPAVIVARYNHAYLIPHRRAMRHIARGNTRGFQLHYERTHSPNKPWAHQWGHPRWGIYAYHMDLGNDVLGTATGVVPYFHFKYFQPRPNLNLNYQVGGGVTYVSERFQRVENYKNIAIGTRINGTVSMLTEMEWSPINHLDFRAGLNFIHFSNGGYGKPNLGINIINLTAGVGYRFGEELTGQVPPPPPPPGSDLDKAINAMPPKWRFTGLVTVGGKENGPDDPNRYLAYGLHTEAGWQYSHRHYVSLGADVMYSTGILRQLDGDSIDYSSDLVVTRPGLILGWHTTIGRFDILFSSGSYLFNRYKRDGYIYTRLGTRVRITDHLVGNVTLKSHMFVADYVEFGFGYSFFKS